MRTVYYPSAALVPFLTAEADNAGAAMSGQISQMKMGRMRPTSIGIKWTPTIQELSYEGAMLPMGTSITRSQDFSHDIRRISRRKSQVSRGFGRVT